MADGWAGFFSKKGVINYALYPASCLYACGWSCYQSLYRFQIKRAKEPHPLVVCVGNLTVGGTGKTPMTLYLAKLLQELGRDVVISVSGYGTDASEGARLAPGGMLTARDWGDEPAMIRHCLPEVPLVVGRNRVKAAEICADRFEEAVLLLDDGFQHLPLKKHITIVLDPPRSNRFCLPAGPYREPVGNRRRADLVLPGKFVIESRMQFLSSEGEPINPSGVCQVLCALGDPDRLLHSVKNAGFEVDQKRLLRDHDRLDAGNLFDGLSDRLPILVTSKDWVKIKERSDWHRFQIVVASYEVVVTPEQEFRQWLASRLNEIEKTQAV